MLIKMINAIIDLRQIKINTFKKNMKNKEFFINNSIQNFQILTTKSPFQPATNQRQKVSASTNRLKRVTSCHDSRSRLDPSKFRNREVFNSSLYSAKPFNIAVEFQKQKVEEDQKLYSFDNCQSIVKLKKKLLEKQNGQQFVSRLNSTSHHLKTLHQQVQGFESDKNSKLIKKELVLLKQGFEKILKILSKEVQSCDEKYVKLIFSKKSQQMSSNNVLLQGKTLLNGPRSIQASRQFSESESQSSSRLGFTNRKPSTSSSNLRSSRNMDHEAQNSSFNKLKTLTNKLNLVQFENKKFILRIQSLQKQNLAKEQRIRQLEQKIQQMNEKISKVKESEDFYNFKIKKLKEELQVAHIVKQQNLAEKMRYILQHE